MTKNKTVAAWLAFAGGSLGLHRFYLHGARDWLGWLLPVPSGLGLYGLLRVQQFGLDDRWSWVLIPLLGFTLAGCALTAIVYGLTPLQRWNSRFNPTSNPDAPSGHTNWMTIGAIVCALLVGTAVLISTMAVSFQRYFEFQFDRTPASRKPTTGAHLSTGGAPSAALSTQLPGTGSGG